MPRAPKPRTNTTVEKRLGSGAAGAGGGTVLVVLARSLPDTNPWKTPLLIVAPSVTVIVSAIWLFAWRSIIALYRQKQRKRLFAEAKKTLSEGIENPHASEEHRAVLRKRLEAFQLLEAEVYSKEI